MITVYRGAGDKVGEPVVCPLLDENALVHFGEFLMNQSAHQKSQIQVAIAYRSDLALGDIVRISIPSKPEGVAAKVVGISFSLQHGAATQQLTLERSI